VERAREVTRVRGRQLLLAVQETVTSDAEDHRNAARRGVLQEPMRLGQRGGQRRMARRIRGEVLPGDRERADQLQRTVALRDARL
jgi:hypothetical protein